MHYTMTSKQTVCDYMDYATIHGIGRSKNSPFLVLKVFWILALCGSMGMVIWQIYTLYNKYSSYPFRTTVEVKSAKNLKFPIVRVCNTNPVLYSKIPPDSNLEYLVQQAAQKYSIDFSVFNETDMYNYNYSKYNRRISTTPINNDILSETAEKFRMLLSVKNWDQIEELSQSFDDFFLICNFAGSECSGAAINQTRSYDYGICYEFDAEYQATLTTGGYVSAAGPRYSLEMLLFVDSDEGIPFVTSSTGILVTVDTGDSIFLKEKGIFIPTGFEANIALTQVEEVRVPGKSDPPRCISYSGRFADSLEDCQAFCKQDYILEPCGCYQNYFEFATSNESIPLNMIRDNETDIVPCYTDTHYKCVADVLSNFLLYTPDVCLDCLPPCEEVRYQPDVSMVSWPNENFLPILRMMMATKHNLTDLTRDFVRSNMVLVRVYFSSLTYNVIKEEYSYSEVDFISDIGGQLGLWAGFSVLSIFEVVELCLLLCASFRGRKTSPAKTPT